MFGGTNSAYTIDGSESSNGTWRVEVTNDTGATSAEFEFRVFTDADGDGLSDTVKVTFLTQMIVIQILMGLMIMMKSSHT